MSTMDLLTAARMFATQKHVLDNRDLYGVLPYTHHLAAVEAVLIRFGFLADKELLAAAWLHDVVEDTRGRDNEVRIRNIREIFGKNVASLVHAVTSEKGPDRTVRNAITYPKIRAAGERAQVLKLADRIANVEFGGEAGEMYVEEHASSSYGIGVMATTPGVTGRMMNHLDMLLNPSAVEFTVKLPESSVVRVKVAAAFTDHQMTANDDCSCGDRACRRFVR